MCMKTCIHYSLLRKLASYKVCLCFIVLQDFVLYHMIVNFVGIKFLWILLSILYMIIYEVLGHVVFKV